MAKEDRDWFSIGMVFLILALILLPMLGAQVTEWIKISKQPCEERVR